MLLRHNGCTGLIEVQPHDRWMDQSGYFRDIKTADGWTVLDDPAMVAIIDEIKNYHIGRITAQAAMSRMGNSVGSMTGCQADPFRQRHESRLTRTRLGGVNGEEVGGRIGSAE